MEKRQGIIGTIIGASFLLVLGLILIFLLFDSANVQSRFFPEDTERWNQILTTFLISFSIALTFGLIFARKVILALSRANYWKSFFVKFVPSALVTITILLFFGGLFLGAERLNPFRAISYISGAVLIFQLFVVSQIEEIMFRGVIFESLLKNTSPLSASIVTNSVFALYHFGASGGSILVMFLLFGLGMLWTYLKLNGYPILNRINIPKLGRPFGSSRLTQQSNAGSHFAYNLFITGFIGA